MLKSEMPQKTLEKSNMERVIFETTIQYEPSSKSIRSDLSSDLSVGGLYLKTNFPFIIDDNLTLSFFISNGLKEILIFSLARVAWTNLNNKRRKPVYPPGVGLQFVDLSCENFSALSKFIDEYDENKKMNVLCAWCGSYLGMRKGPFGTTTHGICNRCREKLEIEL